IRVRITLSPRMRGEVVLRRLRAIGVAGSVSLTAIALLLAPALGATTQRNKANRAAPTALSGRPVGAFTPAVSDPRLAAALARRGTSLNADFRFTPATASRDRGRIQVDVRAHAVTLADAQRATGPT